jgi:hypothetical protein
MTTTTKRSARRSRPVKFLVLLALGISACNSWVFSSCFPIVPPDDAGDLSWARQVVPVLLGRKVKGRTEAKVIADMVAVTDRPTVLRALMQEPEFAEHWTEVLVNSLKVDREGFQSLSDCYGAPLRPGPDPALAQHILAAAPSVAAPGGAFNMSDVVRSAVALDDLAPIYRAHLFAQQHRPVPLFEQQARDELGMRFEDTYLNRQNTCLACHNSDFSTTGPGSGWNRWYPILGSFEQALCGSSAGGDPVDIHAVFRTDQQFGAGAVAPWGLSQCGTFTSVMTTASGGTPYFTGPLAAGATVTTLAALFKTGHDALAAHGLHRTIPSSVQAACTACKTSCSGNTPLDPEQVTNGTFVRNLLTAHGGATDCGTCHGATQNLWFFGGPATDHWYTHLIGVPSNEVAGGVRVIPGDAANSELVAKLTGAVPQRMPLGGSALSAGDVQKVRDWIDALPSSSTCASCTTLDCDPTHVDGTEAFAYLTAASIVETVWQEAMGYPLTIANYFPRNPGQRGALWSLTEYGFVPAGWSLRELLVRILTANTFNRRPPDTETVAGAPYVEPLLYDPWVIPDPRVPPASDPSWNPSAHPDLYDNAMTDGIYRYSAWSLLRSTQKALDWPGPSRFPSPSTYPASDLERAIGQYFSTASPGFRSTNFAALLAWEKEHGLCASHRTDGNPDWIERLATAAGSFVPAGGDPPLTLGDVLTVERDWLLADGTIGTSAPPGLSQSEQDALTGLVGSLTAQVSTFAAADLRTKLRSVCGVFLETPQFFLAGVVPDGPGIAPRLRVCNGQPCTYQEICSDLAPHLKLPAGLVASCGVDSVTIFDLGNVIAHLRDQFRTKFCPECPVVRIDPTGCFKGSEAACPVQPPACDSRCNRIDCCGGPVPPFDRSGTVLLFAEGATVKAAEGARIRRAGSGRIEPLERGAKLAYGDLLEVPAKGRLELDDRGKARTYEAPKDLRAEKLPPRFVLVTGPKALEGLERTKPLPVLSPEQLQWLRTAGWRRNPDGSTPTAIRPPDRAPGRAEREWAEWLKRARQKR